MTATAIPIPMRASAMVIFNAICRVLLFIAMPMDIGLYYATDDRYYSY
jgi:hypothetical protein